jgi:hypothetical protein
VSKISSIQKVIVVNFHSRRNIILPEEGRPQLFYSFTIRKDWNYECLGIYFFLFGVYKRIKCLNGWSDIFHSCFYNLRDYHKKGEIFNKNVISKMNGITNYLYLRFLDFFLFVQQYPFIIFMSKLVSLIFVKFIF